jgi:hypothetical protein
MRRQLLWLVPLAGSAVLLINVIPSAGWQTDLKSRYLPLVRGLAFDGSGAIFAAGSQQGSFAVAKFATATGELLWRERLGKCCGAHGIVADSAGDVIAIGRLVVGNPNDAGVTVATVVKFKNATGDIVWRHDIPAFGGSALALDSGGNVVGVGTTPEELVIKLVAFKLSGSTGTEIWRQEFTGTAGWARGNAIAVDPADAVVVAGALGNTTTDEDAVVLKLDATTGAETWRYEIGGTSTNARDTSLGVAVDAAGDVITSGEIDNTGTGYDWFVAKLSGATGAEDWRHELDGANWGDGTHGGIAIDSTGDVVAAGLLRNVSGGDYSVVKIDGTTGSELWRYQITGTASLGEAVNVAVNPAGDVFAVGDLNNAVTEGDVTVVSLSGASGSELWRREFSGRRGAATPDGASFAAGTPAEAIAVDSDGSVVVGVTMNNGKRPGDRHFTVAKLTGASGDDAIAGDRFSFTDPGIPALRKIKFASKFGIGMSAENATDPRDGGAVLEIRNPTSGETTALSLPASNWTAPGTPAGLRGYKYLDPSGASPCRLVLIKPNRRLKLSCSGDQIGFSLDEASQGSLVVRLTTGSGPTARRYCTVFGGIVQDAPGSFVARDADAPIDCPFP